MLLNPGASFIPIFGTGSFFIETGMKLHNVRDEWVGKHLRRDLDDVCEGDGWAAAVAFKNGRIAIVPRDRTQPLLEPEVLNKLVEVAVLANREIHHGGHWVPAISDGQVSCLWRDWAGDLVLENTFPETWGRQSRVAREEWVDALDAVWTEGTRRIAEVGDPTAMILKAQGEKSKRRR